MDNANSPDYLSKIKIQVIENLKRTTFAPSVQMTDVPRDPEGMDDEADAVLDDADEDDNKDARWTKRRWDKYVEKEGELSESEDEEENGRNGVRRQPGAPKRMNIMDYQNLAGGLNGDEEIGSGAVSEKRGRSRDRNGGAQRNGSVHSSNGKLSEQSDDEDEIEDEDEDEDVEMADDNTTNGNTINGTRPQEATPPDSPSPVLTNPSASEIVHDMGNDAMEEGDTDLAKDEGIEERELEEIAAEQSTETVERQEEGP